MSTDEFDITFADGYKTPGRRRNNWTATTTPGSGDDADDGYEVGSLWVDVTADIAYICVDSTVSAAVWDNVTGETPAHNLEDHTWSGHLIPDTDDAYQIGSNTKRISDLWAAGTLYADTFEIGGTPPTGAVYSNKYIYADSNTNAGIAPWVVDNSVYGPIIIGHKARGSVGSEASVNTGDDLMGVVGLGHDGTQFGTGGGFIVRASAAGSTSTNAGTVPGEATLWSIAADGTNYYIDFEQTALNPRTDSQIDLGSTGRRYATGYFDDVDVGGSIYGSILTIDATSIVMESLGGQQLQYLGGIFSPLDDGLQSLGAVAQRWANIFLEDTLAMNKASDSTPPYMYMRRSRAGVAAIQSGDRLGEWRLQGYDGSSYDLAAEIWSAASQNWSGSAHGAQLTFAATADGAVGETDYWRLQQDGAWSPVTDSSVDVGTASLRVATGYFDKVDTPEVESASNLTLDAASGSSVYQSINGAINYVADVSAFRPNTAYDNARTLGASNARWSQIWAGTYIAVRKPASAGEVYVGTNANIASPTVMGAYYFQGEDSTDNVRDGAWMRAVGTETWVAATGYGTELRFGTVENASTSITDWWKVANDGAWSPQADSTVDIGTSGIRVATGYFDDVDVSNTILFGSVTISSGSGTPESAVTAPVGSLFLRTDGGSGTSLYVKESGTGNTGWVGK